MEYEEFSPLDNTLINEKENKKKLYVGVKPEVEKFIEKFPLNKSQGYVNYIEKIMVLKNGEWQYDTYIRSNKSIDKKAVKKYISKLEKEYEVFDISYEFHGGPPMGVIMFDYKEIKGDNVWVINLKPKLYEYLKKKGIVGNLEDQYVQVGGNYFEKIWKNLKYEFNNVNNIVIDTINKFFFIEENEVPLDKNIYKPIDQINTHYDGYSYYTYLNVYKDGKFIDKLKIESKQNPIEWQFIMNKILELNKNSKFYGYVYKLTHSLNKGIILETTDDPRFKINYECKYNDYN